MNRPNRHRRRLAALLCLALAGCQQQMANQPYYRPLEPSRIFADERSARPIPVGTVPRGGLQLGPYYTGREAVDPNAAAKAAALIAPDPMGVPALAPVAGGMAGADASAYVRALPIAEDKLADALRRGQQRYNIFCSPCHDLVGNGKGMIVERGFTPPPSLHGDLSRGFLIKGQRVPLRTAPVGYIHEVIAQGYGAMPSYASQIGPDDRWAITAYVRALQFSQYAPVEAVADEKARQQLLDQRGPQE